MSDEKPTFDIPGNWQKWPVLPVGLECAQCDKPFEVGDDVWIIEADFPPGAVSHICLDCAERFLYQIQREQPEALPSVAQKVGMALYRPERDLTLDEITTLEVATKLLQDDKRVIGHSPTIH